MLAADQVVGLGIEPDVSRQVTADQQIAGLVQGDRFDLLALGPAQVSQNYLLHASSPPGPSRALTSVTRKAHP